MPVAFPPIKPSDRDYRPPTHSLTTSRAQSGVTTKRIWGSRPADAELTLSFRHIHTDKAAEIVQAWLASNSGIDTLILPQQVFAGVGAALQTLMLPQMGALAWTFADAPTVTSVGPIWATVTVRLVGQLR